MRKRSALTPAQVGLVTSMAPNETLERIAIALGMSRTTFLNRLAAAGYIIENRRAVKPVPRVRIAEPDLAGAAQ